MSVTGQLLTLAAVIVGAIMSFAATSLNERQRFQREEATRWALLYNWLMAHRQNERSAAIEIRSGRTADAAMIVHAAAALAAARSTSPAVSRVS